MSLHGDASEDLGVRLVLLQGQAVQQPLQLPTRNGKRLSAFCRLRPPERSAIQPPVVEPEPVMVPIEDLELVTTFVAEDKEAAAENVHIETVLHNGAQTVNGLAQIGGATREVNGKSVSGG